MQRSNTAKPPEARATHIHAPQDSYEVSTRSHGPLKFIALTVAALLFLVAALTAWYEIGHNGRVYGGVSVLGRDLSGMTRDQASAALAEASVGYPPDKVQVSGAGQTWSLAASDLGVSVDEQKTLDAALSVGRSGDFLDNIGTQLGAMFNHVDTLPVLKQDAASIEKAVARIAAEIERPAVDSKLEKGEDGIVRLTTSASGVAVDKAALSKALSAAALSLPFGAVTVTTQAVAPNVTEAQLESAKAEALLLTEQPVTLYAGEQSWTLEPADLRSFLTLNHTADGSVTATLDNNELAAFLQPVATKVMVEPRDASIEIGKGTVTLNEDKPGSALDVPAAITAIEGAATGANAESRAVQLPMKAVAASVHKDSLQGLYDKANSLVTQGVRLKYADDGYILRGASVTGFIDVRPAQGGPGPLELVIDDDVLANRVSGVAYYINRPAADARFKMVDGTPAKVAEAKQGLKVNVDVSMEKAKQAITAYTGGDRLQVELDVAVTEPAVANSDLATINTPDLLAFGETYYVGSSANRAHNVEFGTGKIDGALIPPDGIFSTSDTIGDLTLDAGFLMGYGITADGKGGVTTVPSEAGGICQVSTTLFHAVFRSGLHVVERNWHSYWIGTYGRAPSGLQGLDATIAPPDKDFRFQNNTGNWILIKATAGKSTVRFELYGVNPGWTVSIGKPVITNVKKTTQDKITEYSDALPKSSVPVLVEHAQDGFTSSISRVVTDSAGNVVDDWTAKSVYQPAHNRYLIGTGPQK